MIQFSQTLVNILNQPSIEAFYLVDILGYRTTNYYTNITLSNNETFLSDGKLLSVTPPKLSTVVDRELYNITFADPNFEYGQFAEAGLVGQPVSVRLCVVDPVTELPLTNINDTILVYKGRVDSANYSIDTNEVGSTQFNVNCASPMANLEGVKAFYGSKQFIRNLNSNDSSFDQVYEGAGTLAMKWGKK